MSGRRFTAWLLFQMSLPWDKSVRSKQISAVASVMAYMHLSAASAAEKHYHSQTVLHQRLFSPSAFADLVDTFVVFARKRQQVQLVVFQQFFCVFFFTVLQCLCFLYCYPELDKIAFRRYLHVIYFLNIQSTF